VTRAAGRRKLATVAAKKRATRGGTEASGDRPSAEVTREQVAASRARILRERSGAMRSLEEMLADPGAREGSPAWWALEASTLLLGAADLLLRGENAGDVERLVRVAREATRRMELQREARIALLVALLEVRAPRTVTVNGVVRTHSVPGLVRSRVRRLSDQHAERLDDPTIETMSAAVAKTRAQRSADGGKFKQLADAINRAWDGLEPNVSAETLKADLRRARLLLG